MTQLSLNWATPAEARRLSAQAQSILERLQRGRASNADLSAIAQRFGARLFDLRRAGYRVEIVERDRDTGITVYELRQL